MRTKKINAFTILETLVTLTLTILLFVMAMGTYKFFQRQYYRYRQQMVRIDQSIDFYMFFEKDFHESKYVTYFGRELKCYSETTGMTKYVLYDEKIVRSFNDYRDTFDLEVIHFDYNYLHRKKFIIDEFNIELNLNKQNQALFFYKEYTPLVKYRLFNN